MSVHHPTGKRYIWVIVEGEDDRKAYRNFLKDNVKIRVSEGNTKLITIIDQLNDLSHRIIGIFDADFAHIIHNYEYRRDNTFFTDLHDLEMMMISSDKTMKKIANEYLAENNFQRIRQALLVSLKFMSCLKLLNDLGNAEYNFKGLGLNPYFNPASYQFDNMEYLRVILLRSPNKNCVISLDEINERNDSLDSTLEMLYLLCNGHDFLEILLAYMNQTIGQGVSLARLESSFRLAYEYKEFKKTSLCKDLKEWSKQNSFALLK